MGDINDLCADMNIISKKLFEWTKKNTKINIIVPLLK